MQKLRREQQTSFSAWLEAHGIDNINLFTGEYETQPEATETHREESRIQPDESIAAAATDKKNSKEKA